MTFERFEDSLTEEAPPAGLSLALQALWYEANGNWERAHELAQQEEGRDGAWVHAYLHRKEGDRGNAAYWYSRAGRPTADGALEEEWHAITRALLAEQAG